MSDQECLCKRCQLQQSLCVVGALLPEPLGLFLCGLQEHHNGIAWTGVEQLTITDEACLVLQQYQYDIRLGSL